MMQDTQPAVQTSGLSKVYKSGKLGKVAVDSLDLCVNCGEVFGFLGPNGAGKTSTIKMLLGFIRPTCGESYLLGRTASDPDSRRDIGYLPEQPYFHKFMTPREVVSTHAALAGVARRVRKSHVDEIIEMVGLTELARRPVSKMSKGQVQRVGIAQALVGDPKLLILDEPASGLDPIGRYQMRDLILKQRAAGRTVFLSSHLLSEIETVCDRVAVLSHGKLVAIGAPGEIKRDDEHLAVTTGAISLEVEARLVGVDAGLRILEGETVITIAPHLIYDLIDILRQFDLPIVSVIPERESLEQAFLRLAA